MRVVYYIYVCLHAHTSILLSWILRWHVKDGPTHTHTHTSVHKCTIAIVYDPIAPSAASVPLLVHTWYLHMVSSRNAVSSNPKQPQVKCRLHPRSPRHYQSAPYAISYNFPITVKLIARIERTTAKRLNAIPFIGPVPNGKPPRRIILWNRTAACRIQAAGIYQVVG